MQRNLRSVSEIARQLGLSPFVVRDFCSRHNVETFKFGKKWWINKDAFEMHMLSNRINQEPKGE